MLPLRMFPKSLRETLARHCPILPAQTFPKFLIANRNGLELAATPTKQTIELISNRNSVEHPFPMPAKCEFSESRSFSVCSSSFWAPSGSRQMETKIPVTQGKQSAAHILVRNISRLLKSKFPTLSLFLLGAIMECSQSFEFLNCEASA